MLNIHRPRTLQAFAANLVLGLSLTCMPGAHAAPESNPPQPNEENDFSSFTSQPFARYVLTEPAQSPTAGNKQAVTKNYGPCTLYPRNVHVRTGKPSEGKVIGFKPVTKCEHAVESIRHESRLKYKYYLWFRDAPLAGGVPTVAQNRGVARLEQKNIEFKCNGDVDTDFVGNTAGTIVSGGRTYRAEVNTEVFREACKV